METDVHLGEGGIDRVHLLELLVGHVGFGEQDVHVPGHSAGDGMDRVFDIDAARFEQIRQVADRVLGLGHRHAVARRDHDPTGRVEQHGDFVGRR